MKFLNDDSLSQTLSLTGPVNPDMLATVDFYVSQSVGIFIPLLEHCGHEAIPDHAHPAWNFIVHFNQRQVLEGFNTEWSEEGYTVTAIPPSCVHTDKAHELNTRYASLFIAEDFFRAEAALYGSSVPSSDRPFCFSLDADILNYIKEFIAEYEAGLPGCDRLLPCVSLKICHAVIRGILRLSSGFRGVTERIEINKVCDYIHRFYGKKLKVRDLASVAAISESHFARIFKKETLHSPLDYVNMIRIDRAKKLLGANVLSITEIAHETGFSSSSHFSTTFAKFAGLSPAEFQKKAGF
jgi:AraC family transcriptional regulator